MAFNSLVIDNVIELLAGGVPSTNPLCPGATFYLAPNWDLSTPQPTADYVENLVLDGERPYGYRSSNRTPTLPVVIKAPTLAILAAARELLMKTVNAQTWSLTWTRAGSALPMVLDCFRAHPATITYSLPFQNALCSQISIPFEALPYGHSDVPQVVSFASPASVGTGSPSAPPAPVVIDNYSTVSGSGFSRSTQCIVGPFSLFWHFPGGNTAPVYTATGLTGINITGLSALQAWIGLGAPSWPSWARWKKGKVTMAVTLFDNLGNSINVGTTQEHTAANNEGNPNFKLFSGTIPPSGTFNYANVTGYSITVYNYYGLAYGGALLTPSLYVDTLVAMPVTTAAPPANIRGALYTIVPVGTARAALAINAQQPIISQPTTVVLQGIGQFIPPAGVSSLAVTAIGAGGSGASMTSSGVGAGGGSGESGTEAALAISGSAPIPYACGTGGVPGSTGVTVVQYTSAGTATFTVPQGITTLIVECWGGGGGGADGGPGGSGGEYAASTAYAVTPGQVLTITVGRGGSGGSNGNNGSSGKASIVTGGTGTITASGGLGGVSGGSVGPSGGSGSSAPVHVNGGAGGSAPNQGGGGGGEAGSGPPGSATAGSAGSSGGSTSGGAGGTSAGNGGNGGAGGSTNNGGSNGLTPGGGGGGGGAYSSFFGNSGGSGAQGEVQITYGSASGTPAVNGTATTFGPVGATTVTGHGGGSAATGSNTPGVAGTGSSNTAHFNGAAGTAGTAATNGGAGAASAGPAAAGVAGIAAVGGIPPSGGGKGGNGAGSSASAGQSGLAPGGGGGGAWSTGAGQLGGAGGAGTVLVTYTATLLAFATLIAHKPGPTAPQSLQPFVSTASSQDPPDGRQYPITSTIAGQNARFNGTYTIMLAAYNWDNPTSTRTVTVTIYEYQYVGGPVASIPVTRQVTPSTDAHGNIVAINNVTLPIHEIAPDNSTAYYTVGITSQDGSDRFLDILFLDCAGQTVFIATSSQYVNFYIDAPDSDRAIGRILGSAFDRSEALSVTDQVWSVSGGPLTVDPALSNTLMCYCIEGAPAIVASYFPAWFSERLV